MRSMIYPVGIQSFEEIRKGDYCYVDKTAQIYQLVKTGKYYFLSRPRRFGKSLLISTLEAYFQGKKELFHGLAMEALEKEWTTYPVLHLDLNAQKYDTPEALIHVLEENLQYWESLYGASESEIGVARRFNGVIRHAAEKTGKNVVCWWMSTTSVFVHIPWAFLIGKWRKDLSSFSCLFIRLHQKLIRHLKLSVKKKNRTPISPVLFDGRSIRRISRPRVLPAGGKCRKPMSRNHSCWHTPRPDHTTRL